MHTVSSTTPLWIAARKLLGAQGAELFLHWAKVAEDFGAEDIHDLRVASRRLREGLALFAPCFPDRAVARIGKRVKRVTTMLGELRNTDEALLYFATLTPEEKAQADPELSRLLAQLEKEREKAQKRLKADLNGLKPGPLKSAWEALLHRPLLFCSSPVDPFQGFSRFADGAIAARAQTIAELRPRALDQADVGAQHQLRIAVKRLRYRLEILEPLFKSGFAGLLRSLKGYQELLGKLHDLDVFAELVRDRIPEGAGRQSLLRTVAARRNRLYACFVEMDAGSPVDALGATARRSL